MNDWTSYGFPLVVDVPVVERQPNSAVTVGLRYCLRCWSLPWASSSFRADWFIKDLSPMWRMVAGATRMVYGE